MQFSCNQDTLSKYLNIVSRVVSSKPGLPILNNVLFEAAKGKLTMTATDLELGINCWIGAQVGAEGKVTVPAKELSEFVNSVKTEKIDVNLEKNAFVVKANSNTANFNTTSPEDFPSIGDLNQDKPLIRIFKEDLIEAVNKVSFACARDNIKPVLTGVRVEIKEDRIAFVGTDGRRLSRYVVKLSEPVKEELSFIVPARAFEELAHLVGDFSEEDIENDYIDVFLLEDKNQILFRFNDIDMISRLIDGQYPDYKAIIPSTHQTTSEFKKTDFQNSLKIVNIIARNVLGNKLNLKIDNEGNSIFLSASQSDVGSNESEFEAITDGQDLEIAFSGKFLNEVLNNVREEELVFEATNSNAPGVFKIKNEDKYIHLIMPMRL